MVAAFKPRSNLGALAIILLLVLTALVLSILVRVGWLEWKYLNDGMSRSAFSISLIILY